MAGQRSSFGKLQRDRDKKAKAAAKRVRRQEGVDEDPSALGEEASGAPTENGRQVSTEDLLQQIAEVHQEFDAGTISYEYFEERKADLLSRLSVD